MKPVRRTYLIALLLAFAAVVVLWLWQSAGRGPEAGLPSTNSQQSEANRPGLARQGLQPDEPAAAPRVELAVTPDTAKPGQHKIPVQWIGRAPESAIELVLRSDDGREATATLDAREISLAIPPVGDYRFDFAAAHVFGPDHRLLSKGQAGGLSVAAFQFGSSSSLLLALAVPVRVTVGFRDGESRPRDIELRWSPRRWLPAVVKPVASLGMRLDEVVECLVPADGIEFQIATKGVAVVSPRPQQFVPSGPGDALRIVLGALVPVTVDVVETEPGQWQKVRLKRPDALFLVQLAATEVATGKSVPLNTNEALHGPEAPEPGVAERFQLFMPPLEHDCFVHATVKLHGAGIEATGSVAAGPYSREVRIIATPVQRCTLSVRVIAEDGSPMAGVVVEVACYLETSSAHSTSVGPPATGTTDEAGTVLVPDLPSAERLVAQLTLPFGLSAVEDFSRVPLDKPGLMNISVTVRTSATGRFELAVRGGKAWRPNNLVRAVIVEGDMLGRWFKLSRHDVVADGVPLSFRTTHERALLLLQSGHCLVAREVLSSTASQRIEIDLDETVEVQRRTTAPEAAAAFLMLPEIDPALAWSSIQEGECTLPHVRIDPNGQYKLRVEAAALEGRAVVAAAEGRIYLQRMLSAPAEGMEAAPVSTVEITLHAGANARDLQVNLCTVFHDDGRTVSAEMGHARVFALAAGEAARSIELPHGRFVAVATWIDKEGAQRFGLYEGQYAEFESRPGQKTLVTLRAP